MKSEVPETSNTPDWLQVDIRRPIRLPPFLKHLQMNVLSAPESIWMLLIQVLIEIKSVTLDYSSLLHFFFFFEDAQD